MHHLSIGTEITTPDSRTQANARAKARSWSVDAAMRFGRLASLAILPTIALIGSVVGGPSATESFVSECNRIYTSAVCGCAAGRAEAAVGSARFARVSGEIFMHPQLQATATYVVQSCMLGGDEIAD